ncbi:DUF5988 family protein [Streptomyces hokutonensis]|uniref:DUF5988 family protein n=1 Tax=Streptomyces hokutonensis TaxID=1306990 RepID=UPI0003619642|nr:DUF5988 family protein [Streptomyces hokutonensis]
MTAPEPNAILTGGPSSVPEEERLRYVADTGTKIRLLSGNRWEHFDPTTRVIRHHGRDLLVFVWSRHTYIAE